MATVCNSYVHPCSDHKVGLSANSDKAATEFLTDRLCSATRHLQRKWQQSVTNMCTSVQTTQWKWKFWLTYTFLFTSFRQSGSKILNSHAHTYLLFLDRSATNVVTHLHTVVCQPQHTQWQRSPSSPESWRGSHQRSAASALCTGTKSGRNLSLGVGFTKRSRLSALWQWHGK